jgi:hypothetical protein
VHQFTALTAGLNPWGGVGCGVDSGEMNSCSAYVQTKSTPADEVLPAHAFFCLPRWVCDSRRVVLSQRRRGGECERGSASEVSVCDVALARDDWGRQTSSPVMDHSKPISSALTWLRRLLRTEGVKLRAQDTSFVRARWLVSSAPPYFNLNQWC